MTTIVPISPLHVKAARYLPQAVFSLGAVTTTALAALRYLKPAGPLTAIVTKIPAYRYLAYAGLAFLIGSWIIRQVVFPSRYYTKLLQDILIAAEADFDPQKPLSESTMQAMVNLIDAGADPKTRAGQFQSSVIHWAAFYGSRELIEQLTTQGLSLTEKNGRGQSVLHAAAMGGQTDLAKWLITQHRIKPHDTDNQGSSALHAAAWSGHQEFIEWFITLNGISLTEKNKKGWTVLHAAAIGGHIDLVKWLITQPGIKPNDTDNQGRTALDVVKRHKYPELYEYLSGQMNASAQ